jgi:hydrogenase maturation protein HypF
VQGVGFRPWVYRVARELGIGGRVRNDSAGVTIEAFGDADAIEQLTAELHRAPSPARVVSVEWNEVPPESSGTFAIDASADASRTRVSIPPDLAVCDACVAEIFDPNNRRYRYAFTNCTHCGPRFTVAQGIPYDRPATTMAPFAMCAECKREYDDPCDRRFHAQPNACPVCGPKLAVADGDGKRRDGDPIAIAARAIEDGLVVAVKGLGGYHLACDATNEGAVSRLRQRKHRDEKPFAVMVRDRAEAEKIAALRDADRALLTSIERPIVIVDRRPDAELARAIAPGSPKVGVMLAYTPLHHLFLAEANRAIVMTSGNVSDEPIAFRDDDALARLARVADLFLTHDRAIESRCDDSVACVVLDRPMLVRRSRGYVPREVRLARPLERPVLACGAHLKNTFCLGAGDTAIVGPHVGDLDHLSVVRSYEEAIARLERFTTIRPEIVAHDLHPEYASTRYAEERPEPVKIAVQHHHAHAASVMAEHGIAGPAIAVVYDGTGYGDDGTSWGGEVLLAEYARFRRIATFRPLRLAGGDRAVKQPWRTALALLADAYCAPIDLTRMRPFDAIPPRAVSTIRAMIDRDLNAPRARGVGRYFDAVAALALGRAEIAFEGQAAIELMLAADPDERARYAFEVHDGREPWEIDLRPLAREVVRDLEARVPASAVAARFHNSVAAATIEVVRRATREHGVLPVVLSGGCFQNARLTESIEPVLAFTLEVHRNEQVPPGDGGVSLGQLVVADAIARSGSCA